MRAEMERQMGRETLKHVLSEQVQTLERDFVSLTQTSSTWNDLHLRSLNILTITIRRLVETIHGLPEQEWLSVDMRHELRNQITVVMGYAQLMMHRRAGELPVEAAAYLEKIMSTVMRINSSLDRHKKARNG